MTITSEEQREKWRASYKRRYQQRHAEMLAAKRAYYHNNKDKYKEYQKAWKQRTGYKQVKEDTVKNTSRCASRRVAIRSWLNELKVKTPCADCHQHYHPYVMDFDHLPKFKKHMPVSTMSGRRYSKSRIIEEINKCELVCANCHRLRTITRKEQLNV